MKRRKFLITLGKTISLAAITPRLLKYSPTLGDLKAKEYFEHSPCKDQDSLLSNSTGTTTETQSTTTTSTTRAWYHDRRL